MGTADHDSHTGHTDGTSHDAHAGHANHTNHDAHDTPGHESSFGLRRAEGGYQLDRVSAPATTDEAGTLAFTITGPDGEPTTAFTDEHEKKLHLIVARSDGAHFRHVHPVLDAAGVWSIPWRWEAAGSYRLFADFIPSAGGSGLTLSDTFAVSGAVTLDPAIPLTRTSVGGYDVAVSGSLSPNIGSELRFAVSRDGAPVTTLEPYLGAFGHLVALRDGDLAHLHVHPHGDAPRQGETSGPEIDFVATAPTPGRYLLFLDFQIAGEVFTARLVLDTVD